MRLNRIFSTIILLLTAIGLQAQNLKLKWKLFPQDDNTYTVEQLSQPNFSAAGWIDAIVPGTVFHAYVRAGKEIDPDYADNIYKVDKTKYNKPYWYRTEFSLPPALPGKRVWLNFNGINKRGEIYLNGKHIGTVNGLMQRGIFDVTSIVSKHTPNVLAVLVFTPDPAMALANRQAPTYLSSGSWDWMPAVPGLNSGITDSVSISTTGPVAIVDPWIKTDLVSKTQANLQVRLKVRNVSSTTVKGNLKIRISPGNILISSPTLTLEPESEKEVAYDKAQFAQLIIKNPKLWWPNGYGKQNLYSCKISFAAKGAPESDKISRTFGIRKVTADTTSLNGPMRVFVNDVPILLKGGNWGMSDYMLKVRGKDYEPRIRFHQDMNFNMIRNWTGEVTDDAFYQYCDKYGIMVWDDFWLNNFGPIDSLDVFGSNAAEKVKKLRHHPSIVIWCGANEGLPGGDPNGPLSKVIKAAIKDNDGDSRLYVPRSNAGVSNPNFSIHGGSRNLSGSGIWGNVDPNTYFTDPHNGYLFSRGSWGLRSELGTATFVNVESFKKFMPKDYWVAPTIKSVDSKTNMWARHYFSTDGELGGGSQPVNYINSINKSYGEASSLEDFARKAQMLNLETMKAMFEGWNDHMWKDASGMLIWMSQSAYPSMIWQTYDYYYDLTGAYFGAKTACEQVHIQWNPATNSVKVINNRPYDLNGITARAEVYNLSGKLVEGRSQSKKLNARATSATQAFVAFHADNKQGDLSDVYFLKLKLNDGSGKLLSENFYWIGKSYLDYTALDKMPAIGTNLVQRKLKETDALNHVNKVISYHITNTSKTTAAFGIRAQLIDRDGKQILPALYSDGYFSLTRGESKVLKVEVDPKLLTKGYTLQLKAFNN